MTRSPVAVAALLLITASLTCTAQKIPANPNLEKDGKRVGKWTILMDSHWRPTKNSDSVTFYRVITYKDDQPVGTVRDFYRDGRVQWEGILLADRPSERPDGIVTWYHHNGNRQQQSEYTEGKLQWNSYFKEDGTKDVWNTSFSEGR